jgi:hypothetical protein
MHLAHRLREDHSRWSNSIPRRLKISFIRRQKKDPGRITLLRKAGHHAHGSHFSTTVALCELRIYLFMISIRMPIGIKVLLLVSERSRRQWG